MNARRIALDILMAIEEEKAYSNIAILKHLYNQKISHLDRKLITELVYGVLENKIYLDFIIKQLSKIQITSLDKGIRMILRMGLYQIIYLDKIPAFAVVNESVRLAKKVNVKASGYVNGLLRNFLREHKKIKIPSAKDNLVAHLSIRYSHPEWLVEKWIHQLGEEFTAELLKANNERPLLTIRTNTLKIDKQRLVQILSKEGAKVSNGLHVEDALYIKDIGNIAKLESFQNGYFQVQDESSMLAVHALDPKPGEFVLDLCAAPGGKSTYIAQLMKNEGIILARDIYDHKIKLVQDHAARLGIHIIQTEVFDATKFDHSLIEKADKVLLDAPCSGLGIVRRKPEIKYSKQPKDLKAIADLQLTILNHAGRYVKKGGILVYSTCTINKEENQDLIQKFIKQNTEFEISDANAFLPATIKNDNKMIQLFPNVHGTDGFFICRLKKK